MKMEMVFGSKPLLKMIISHLIMVIASICFGSEYKSGVGNRTSVTTSSKNNKTCTLPWRPSYTAKSFTSHIIPLHPSTILTIVRIGSGFIKVNNWPILLTIIDHLTKVSMPLFHNTRLFVVVAFVIHFLMSMKYNINRHHKKVMVIHLKLISFNKM